MKTQKIFSRARLNAGVAPVVLGLALISAPAHAQTAQAPQAAEDTSADEIVVTGTLIQNPNLTSSSPIAVVGAEEIGLRQRGDAVRRVLQTRERSEGSQEADLPGAAGG